MKFSHLEFKGVKGVGSIEVDFTPDKRVHVFIGENGVGKTKFLEVLFQFHFLGNDIVKDTFKNIYKTVNSKLSEEDKLQEDYPGLPLVVHNWLASEIIVDNFQYDRRMEVFKFISLSPIIISAEENMAAPPHQFPLVFIAAHNRGFIRDTDQQVIPSIGKFGYRRKIYIESIASGMNDNFSSLNMSVDIEQWFISIAQSSNAFQAKEDNREIEIRIVLKLFNKLDDRIDPKFMEIGGDNRVFLKLNGKKIQLSHLSTGYASILKIIQSIISGYGYFTNEQQLQHVRGIVLIDEIESHLHLSWQSKIIPTLKELFPNTTFYITTHSPVVLVQLEEGEAYRLQREDDGVVRSEIIHHPSNISFIDLQKQAFDLDLNKIKRDNVSADSQKEAKQKLLDFINKERQKASS